MGGKHSPMGERRKTLLLANDLQDFLDTYTKKGSYSKRIEIENRTIFNLGIVDRIVVLKFLPTNSGIPVFWCAVNLIRYIYGDRSHVLKVLQMKTPSKGILRLLTDKKEILHVEKLRNPKLLSLWKEWEKEKQEKKREVERFEKFLSQRNQEILKTWER